MKKKYLNVYIPDSLNDLNFGSFDVVVHDTVKDANNKMYAKKGSGVNPAKGYWKCLGTLEVPASKFKTKGKNLLLK
jgi:hypothetical protein